MPASTLTTGPDLDDTQVDTALTALPPLDDNVLVALRHLQAQVVALTARVETLETP